MAPDSDTFAPIVSRILDTISCDAALRSRTVDVLSAEVTALLVEAQRHSEEACRLRALLAQALDLLPEDHPLAAEVNQALN